MWLWRPSVRIRLSTPLYILGCRQAVRHSTLTAAFVGSNPATPATSEQSPLCSDFFFADGVKRRLRPLPCLPSCGARLRRRRINRLVARRPLRRHVLAVSRTADARGHCPFPQKITFGSPARPETPSRRFAVATNLFRWFGGSSPSAKRMRHLFATSLQCNAEPISFGFSVIFHF